MIDEPKNASLLIAMPQLLDPNFKKSIILIAEHSDAGAIGFIINQESDLDLETVLKDGQIGLLPKNCNAWIGGPVVEENGLILHNDEPGDGDMVIAPGISLSSDDDILKKLVDHDPKKDDRCLYPYRFILGYAGWGPGQLDLEIRAGSWIQASPDKEIIFDVDRGRMWDACLRTIGIADSNKITLSSSSYLN